MQLSNQTLNQLPAGIQRPSYDRSQVARSIVHLGVGAFHRAHQAMYTEAVLASGDLAWGIVGAGIVSSAMKTALQPQDGLYTLAAMGPAGDQLQVIGAILEVLGGEDDDGQLLDIMRAPSTRIVSMTVTEKGYYLDPATGDLQLQLPAIQADLANPATPKTILGLIVRALQHRRIAGIPPFTVLSCDNLPSNGKRAKAAVVAFAQAVDGELADWISAKVAFPCTMVDRITPATTDVDSANISAQIGMTDAWPVVTWLRALRADGIANPVRIGMAGPASIPALLRFAQRCGVRASARGFARDTASIGRMFSQATPAAMVRDLAEAAASENLGEIAAHIYSFGGLSQAAKWTRDAQRGEIN